MKRGLPAQSRRCSSALAPQVAKLGGIEPLVTLLVTGGSEVSEANAVGALASLCHKHAENRDAIAKLMVTPDATTQAYYITRPQSLPDHVSWGRNTRIYITCL